MPQKGSQGVLFYLVLLCLWHGLLELLVIPPSWWCRVFIPCVQLGRTYPVIVGYKQRRVSSLSVGTSFEVMMSPRAIRSGSSMLVQGCDLRAGHRLSTTQDGEVDPRSRLSSLGHVFLAIVGLTPCSRVVAWSGTPSLTKDHHLGQKRS
jgi:hypothetical protein